MGNEITFEIKRQQVAKRKAWHYLNDLYGREKENRDESLIKRGVYKYTDCGAWVTFNENGVKLGSIVEGSDHGADSIDLTWKDIPTEFTNSLDMIEEQCDLIWNWANTERDDGKTDMETGLDWPLL
jgi:hypothetical protein